MSNGVSLMQQTIHHPEVGDLYYDETLGWFEGSILMNGERVAIQLSAESDAELAPLLERASVEIPALASRIGQAKSFAAQSLIALKNGEWSDAAGPVSEEKFASVLCKASVTLYPDCTTEFVFQDGGLFFGHSVLVSFNEAEGFTDAFIAG